MKKELLEIRELKVFLGIEGLKEQREMLDQSGILELQVMLVPQVLMGIKVLLEIKVYRELKEILVQLALLAISERQVQRAMLEPRVSKAYLGNRVQLALKELLEHLETKVYLA